MEYRIVIDGTYEISIGPGKLVEIEFSTGHHRIQARAGTRRSVTVGIEAAPEGIYHLTAGRISMGWRKLSIFLLLNGLVALAFAFLVLTDIKLSAHVSWLDGLFTLSSIIVLPSLHIASLIYWGSNRLYLMEVPSFDSSGQRIVGSPRAEPHHLRITIQQAMIAVALLAIFLGLGIEGSRDTKQHYFEKQVGFHEAFEGISRVNHQRQIMYAAYYEGRGRDAALFRRSAAKHLAKAEYHAAMRRKYEAAVSRRLLSVEPDPPEPISP